MAKNDDGYLIVEGDTCQQHSLLNGFEIKVHGRSLSYTCKWLSRMKAFDWEVVITGSEPCDKEHIRFLPCYAENVKDIEGLVSEYDTPCTKAIVLLGDDNSKIRWLNTTSCPVLSVNSKVAEHLMVILDGYVAMGRVKLESYTPGDLESFTTKERTVSTGQEFRSVAVVDLKSHIEQLMLFSSGIPVRVTQNREVFSKVMHAFHSYERVKNSISHGKLFKLFKNHFQATFEMDFPFYVILAYRISQDPRLYPGEEATDIVNTCIEMMERMNPELMSSTLNAMIECGCHFVEFGQYSRPICILYLLEEACLFMSELSLHSTQSPEGRIYRSLVWVSVALKCHVEHGIVQSWVRALWDRLLELGKETVVSQSTIQELEKGLTWTALLNIPPAAMLSADQAANLFTFDSVAVNPFSHLMSYIQLMNLYIHDSVFVAAFTQLNTVVFSTFSHVWQNSTECTLAGVAHEGLAYLEKLNTLLRYNGMEKDICDEMVFKWLSLVLHLIPLGTESWIELFLSEDYPLLQLHGSRLSQEIVGRMRVSLSKISINHFLELYLRFKFLSNELELLEKYINEYELSAGSMCVMDRVWSELFTEVTRRHPDKGTLIVLQFLMKVGNQYDNEGRSTDFIHDLINMNFLQLFEHSTEDILQIFTKYLENYIMQKILKNGSLVSSFQTIMYTTQRSGDRLQAIIFTVFQRVASDLIVNEIVEKANVAVFNVFASKLVASKSLEDTLKIPQYKLCWSIISSCCSKIAACSDLIEQCKLHAELVHSLAQVYSVINKTEAALPQCEDENCQGFFMWIKGISQMLHQWYTKIHHGAFTYNELMYYISHYPYLCPIANELHLEHLIISMDELNAAKSHYLGLFEKLIVHFIKYIPGNRETKYCTLAEILTEHGIQFPSEFVRVLQSPTDKMDCVIPKKINGIFQPPVNVSVQTGDSLTLAELELLVPSLDSYVQPISEHMDLLVTFYIRQNGVFKSYIQLQLEEEMLIEDTSIRKSIVTPSNLANAMKKAKPLLERICSGKASYLEIIGNGKLVVNSSDVKADCQTLVHLLGQTFSDSDGAEALYTMLELHQYICTFLPALYRVCDLYKLNGCLMSSNLTQLMVIAEEYVPNGQRAKQLTLLEARDTLKCIKELLCFKTLNVFNAGTLFLTVAKNADVCQFFRKIVGTESDKIRFDEQCCVIKARLNFNVSTLEHLCACYNFIEPFLNTTQNIQSLLGKVAHLDSMAGLKHFEGLKSMTELIELWFTKEESNQETSQKSDPLLTNLAHSIKLLSDQNDEYKTKNLALENALISAQTMHRATTLHCTELHNQLESTISALHHERDLSQNAQKCYNTALNEMIRQHRKELDQVRNELHTQLLREKEQEKEQQKEFVAKHNVKIERVKMELNEQHAAEKAQLQSALKRTQVLLQDEKKLNQQMHHDLDVMRNKLKRLEEEHLNNTKLSNWIIQRSDIELYHERQLGGGAWGYVVEGRFRGQKVAIKCIHRDILNPVTLKKVHHEITTMAQLRHPNLVLFIGAVLDDQGGPLIVTELLEVTLRTAYQRDLLGSGLRQSVCILHQVASALCYLHQLEIPIIHQDVSSSNVLLEARTKPTWKAKLSDFGSANWVHQAATGGEGSFAYSAPEAYPVPPGHPNKPLTTKVDVYSYGVLVCEVVLRNFPDPAHLKEAKEMLRNNFSDIYSLVVKCICVDPSTRPAMATIITELEQIITQ